MARLKSTHIIPPSLNPLYILSAAARLPGYHSQLSGDNSHRVLITNHPGWEFHLGLLWGGD